jgi:hypothetical protein
MFIRVFTIYTAVYTNMYTNMLFISAAYIYVVKQFFPEKSTKQYVIP